MTIWSHLHISSSIFSVGHCPGLVLGPMIETSSSRANERHQSMTCALRFPSNLLLSWHTLARLHLRTNLIMTGFERYSKLYCRRKRTLLTPTCLIGINLSESSVHWKNIHMKPILTGGNASPSCPTTECELSRYFFPAIGLIVV